MIKNQIVELFGRRWKIREAVNKVQAHGTILDVVMNGGVGGRRVLDQRSVGGGLIVQADVIEVNSDDTERQLCA